MCGDGVAKFSKFQNVEMAIKVRRDEIESSFERSRKFVETKIFVRADEIESSSRRTLKFVNTKLTRRARDYIMIMTRCQRDMYHIDICDMSCYNASNVRAIIS
jgi:hypothetical protein